MGVDEAAPGGGDGIRVLLRRKQVDSDRARAAGGHQLAKELSVMQLIAIAGLFLGTVTGGLIGLATESGLFRGTRIGAITRALVSIEVVHSSIRLWRSRRSGIWSILYVVTTRN
ncbi:NEP1-interacting protein-like 1 [Hordeum vulgare]|nr:NEP1-interacting protein-like 1 [Hordeum vulgare]